MNTNGPFDGLLGFSQGGGTVQMVIEWLKNQENAKKLNSKIKFLILICSGLSMTPFKNIFDDKKQKEFLNPIPTMHLIGENDFLYH